MKFVYWVIIAIAMIAITMSSSMRVNFLFMAFPLFED